MANETGEGDASWHYASPRTLAGALQRGLGRGARRAMVDPAAPELISDCLRRDYRWDWQVDERHVYLARLVRDLRLPVEPLTDRLFTSPAAVRDDDNVFFTTLGVLEVLGQAGVDGVVDEVRRYVRHGERWVDALEAVASSWPAVCWDDLYPTVLDRLDAAAAEQARWLSPPWTGWAARDRRIAGAVTAARRRTGRARPLADVPTSDLLSVLGDTGRTAHWRMALRELRQRPPEPTLLDLVDSLLAAAADVGWPLARVLRRLGPLAVPAARSWAADTAHPLAWTGLRLLAAHGGGSDAPALSTGLDWLDSRPDDLCGYDELVMGLARIGGPQAVAALPRIRWLWFSPHSFERADYLRARMALDPDGASRCLTEGLWDCESRVRLLAIRHAPRNDLTRERLHQLGADPVETAEVRAAAGARLG